MLAHPLCLDGLPAAEPARAPLGCRWVRTGEHASAASSVRLLRSACRWPQAVAKPVRNLRLVTASCLSLTAWRRPESNRLQPACKAGSLP